MSALVQHADLADPDVHEPKGASTANNGDVLTSDGAGGTSWQPAGGSGSAFGQDYQSVASLALSTTASATFQNKVNLTTPALTGTYLITWHAVIRQENAADACQVQLTNDTDGGLVGVLQDHEPKDSNNRIKVGGFAEISFTGAAKSFTMQWRQQRGGTAGIEDARIMIWRVS